MQNGPFLHSEDIKKLLENSRIYKKLLNKLKELDRGGCALWRVTVTMATIVRVAGSQVLWEGSRNKEP